MKLGYIILLGLIAFLLTGCERYGVIDLKVPYQERIAAGCFLAAGDSVAQVWLTKTEPAINFPAQQDPIYITDATVTLQTPGGEVTLVYDSNEKVYTYSFVGETFEPGVTYKLQVKGANETVTGTTQVPGDAQVELSYRIDSILTYGGPAYKVQLNARLTSAEKCNLVFLPLLVSGNGEPFPLNFTARKRAVTLKQFQQVSQEFTSYAGAEKPQKLVVQVYTCDEPYATYFNQNSIFSFGELGSPFADVSVTYSNLSNGIGIFSSYKLTAVKEFNLN